MSEENTEPQMAQLQLGDIEGCVRIIDVAAKRGAFEGAELADVGAIRNRMAEFIAITKEQTKTTEEESDEVDEE